MKDAVKAIHLQALRQLFSSSRRTKQLTTLFIDGTFIFGCYWLAFTLRLESLFLLYSFKHWCCGMLLLASSLCIFYRMGLYRTVLRYLSYQSLQIVITGILLPTMIWTITAILLRLDLPIAIPVTYAGWAILCCSSFRLLVRTIVQRMTHLPKGVPLVIYGAGQAGRQFAASLQQNIQYDVKGFIDDDQSLHRSLVYGIPIYARNELPTLCRQHKHLRLLIAIPSLDKNRRSMLLNDLSSLPIKVMTLPSLIDIVSGKSSVTQVSDINIEDLLGREHIPALPHLLEANIHNHSVLVTGAGGSIGSELCRQIAAQQPKLLILYESNEYSLYRIHHELLRQFHYRPSMLLPVLGDINQQSHLEILMNKHRIHTVYHAAAYKHVPLVESNVCVTVHNNVIGTLSTVDAAQRSQVKHFVFVSTDKAVRPTSIMGATKRVAELVCQAYANKHPEMKIAIVRFGNVLGSSGSVIPLMQQQISQGGPITVTHTEVTRYFMSIPEAASLVIQAGNMTFKGEIFVLDMGQPIKILNLAKQMINLMGMTVKSVENPEGDIEIKLIGLRRGEKLYEELLIGNNTVATQHPRIRAACEISLTSPKLDTLLQSLRLALISGDIAKITYLFRVPEIGYCPQPMTEKEEVHELSHSVANTNGNTSDATISPC